MNTDNLKQAIGVFPNWETVEQAVLGLQSINFPMNQITVVTKKSSVIRNSIDTANQRPATRVEGAKAGAILGSLKVGLMTLAIGLGILLVPGVSPAIALDSILTAFLGSSIASITGGLYGALLGYLDPEKQIKFYRGQFGLGDCLVIIEATESQILSVEPILYRCHVQSWQVYDIPKLSKP